MLRQNPPSRDLLQKMPLRKLSHFCIRYFSKTKCKSKKQLCNDAFHVKTSQSAQTQLDPVKNRNRPKMLYMPFLHESLQLCTILVRLINHAAMGRARFMFYPWFIFFYFFFVGDQTQISTRPTLNYAICNVYLPNPVSSGSTKISSFAGKN